MSNYRIGLLCEDEDYGRSLQNYFISKAEHYFITVLFTSEEQVLQYLEDNSLDILLSDMNIVLENIKTICLKERKIDNCFDSGNDEVYRYQKASDILEHIYKCLRDGRGNAIKVRGETKILAVYSPVERSGKTSFANTLCESNHLEKNLYIGMELFGENKDLWGMDNLIYYLKQRDENIIEIITNNIITKNYYEIIASPYVYTDMLELNYTDMEWLIEKLRSMTDYSKIVFDIDILSDLRILDLFDEIYMPILKGYEYKVDRFENVLDRLELSMIKKHVEKVNLIDINNKEELNDLVRRYT